MSETININGKQYDTGSISASARQQIANIRAADQEIERLRLQLAITQTARTAYSNSLLQELGDVERNTEIS